MQMHLLCQEISCAISDPAHMHAPAFAQVASPPTNAHPLSCADKEESQSAWASDPDAVRACMRCVTHISYTCMCKHRNTTYRHTWDFPTK